MAFNRLTQNQYPCRQWALAGEPGSGKSTFATQMAGPVLVINADHRFDEVMVNSMSDFYELSNNQADNVDPQRIAQLLQGNMPSASVKTIVIDSLTAIIAPLVTKAIMANDAGGNKNRVAGFRSKAMAMRLLQDEITRWGADTLWIYHLRQGLDGQARQVENTSISRVELARLQRSLNMELRVVTDGDRRGITVEWARRGRYPITIWDETGCFRGMPERIEEAVYGGLSQSDQAKLQNATPASFSGPADAIAWGYNQGCFRDAVHANNAYEALKREKAPPSAHAMWNIWIDDVQERVAALRAPSDEEYDHLQSTLSNIS